jgi:hypothetical protein
LFDGIGTLARAQNPGSPGLRALRKRKEVHAIYVLSHNRAHIQIISLISTYHPSTDLTLFESTDDFQLAFVLSKLHKGV